MVLTINNLKADKGASKKRKRIGRGNSSGSGTYSGRGLKGQKARSGVSNLKRLGMKQVLLRTPKLRGTKSNKPKAQIVNLSALNKYFKDGENITPASLKKKGLIKELERPVKILSQGELKVKELSFSGVAASDSARKKIIDQKGKIL